MRERNTAGQIVLTSALLLAALFLPPLRTPAPPRELPPRQEEPAPPRETVEINAEEPVTLRVLHGGTVAEMELEEYLVGVLRAEMPASFPLEALKAQTVAARTYTLYKLRSGSHGAGADICTDPACCQAWRDAEAGDACEEKRKIAVAETAGEVVLYGGEPILAVFHAASAGRTRAAGDVWSGDLPYLQAVDSPEAAEQIPDYYSRADFTAAEFRERVLEALPEANLSGEPENWLQDPVTDSAGSVETVEVGGVRVKGGTLRSALGLRSACFTWETTGEGITFYVTGYGHGVGLSQYGAEAMAAAGADYREILLHYYVGTTIGRWQP